MATLNFKGKSFIQNHHLAVKKRLVFAPAKYLDLNDADLVERHGLKGIEYCQLPFEIYKMRGVS